MRTKYFFVFTGGLLFGFGLAFGGMSKPEIVLSFLQLKDLGLLILLGSSAFVTAITINLIPKVLNRPLLGEEFKKRHKKTFVKGKRIYAKDKRKFRDGLLFVKFLIKEKYVKEKVKAVRIITKL